MKSELLDDLPIELNLPYEFQVNKEQWETKLEELSKKSAIGTLIIIILGLLLNFLIGGGILTIALIAVLLLFSVSRLKEKKELALISENSYVLSQERISVSNPTKEIKIIERKNLIRVQKHNWGLELHSKSDKQKVSLRIPHAVPRYNDVVKYFKNLGLLEL